MLKSLITLVLLSLVITCSAVTPFDYPIWTGSINTGVNPTGGTCFGNSANALAPAAFTFLTNPINGARTIVFNRPTTSTFSSGGTAAAFPAMGTQGTASVDSTSSCVTDVSTNTTYKYSIAANNVGLPTISITTCTVAGSRAACPSLLSSSTCTDSANHCEVFTGTYGYVPDTLCSAYCNNMQGQCTGGNALYASVTACSTACAAFDLSGGDTDSTTNTGQCRVFNWMSAILGGASTALQCASGSGCTATNTPPTTCARYCQLVYEACPAGTALGTLAGFQPDQHDCLLRCGNWTATGGLYSDSLACHAGSTQLAKATPYATVNPDPTTVSLLPILKAVYCANTGRVSLTCNPAMAYAGRWYAVPNLCTPDALPTGPCCAIPGVEGGAAPITNEPSLFQFGAAVQGGGCLGFSLIGGNFTVKSAEHAEASLSAAGITVKFALNFTAGTNYGQLVLTNSLFAPAIFCKDLDSNCPAAAAQTTPNGVWVGSAKTLSDGATSCSSSTTPTKALEIITIRNSSMHMYVSQSIPLQVATDTTTGTAHTGRNYNYVLDTNLKVGSCAALTDTTTNVLSTVDASVVHGKLNVDTITLSTCTPQYGGTTNQTTCVTAGGNATCSSTSVCNTFTGVRITPANTCAAYCGMMLAACSSSYTSYQSCLTTCGGFATLGVAGDTSYNTLQCRLTYALQAHQGDATKCALAAAVSTSCTGTIDVTCVRYCATYMQNCGGVNNYMGAATTQASCVASCTAAYGSSLTQYPIGTLAGAPTPSLGCRLNRTALAYSASSPSSMCAAAVDTSYCKYQVTADSASKFLGNYVTVPGCIQGGAILQCCCLRGNWSISAVAGNPYAVTVYAPLTTTGGALGACAGLSNITAQFTLTSDTTASVALSQAGITLQATVTYEYGGQVTVGVSLFPCKSYACRNLDDSATCPVNPHYSSSSSTSTIYFSGVRQASQPVSSVVLFATFVVMTIIKLYIA